MELILTLLLVGGGGAFLCRDAGNHFASTKKLLGAVSERGQQLLHGPPSQEEQSKRILAHYGQRVHQLREGVATIEAGREECRRNIESEETARERARRVIAQALKLGDEHAAQEAAAAVVNCEDRLSEYRRLEEDLGRVAQQLRDELQDCETRLSVVQTTAETVVVLGAIAAAQRAAYDLVSDVGPQGLSVGGELHALEAGAKKNVAVSSAMLKMARDSAGRRTFEASIVEVDGRIEEELAAAREQLALPAGREGETATE